MTTEALDAANAALAQRIAVIEGELRLVEQRPGEKRKPTRIEAMESELASIKRWVQVTLAAVGLAKILPPGLLDAALKFFGAFGGG